MKNNILNYDSYLKESLNESLVDWSADAKSSIRLALFKYSTRIKSKGNTFDKKIDSLLIKNIDQHLEDHLSTEEMEQFKNIQSKILSDIESNVIKSFSDLSSSLEKELEFTL